MGAVRVRERHARGELVRDAHARSAQLASLLEVHLHGDGWGTVVSAFMHAPRSSNALST